MYLAVYRQTPYHPVKQVVAPSQIIINKCIRELQPQFWRIRDSSGWIESSEPNAYAALYGPVDDTAVLWQLSDV